MNETPPLTLDSVVCLSGQQLSSRVANETVVLDTSGGMYYGLNEMAAFIWERMTTPSTVRRVRDAILAEFEVDVAECERDLLALLVRLQADGLIAVQSL